MFVYVCVCVADKSNVATSAWQDICELWLCVLLTNHRWPPEQNMTVNPYRTLMAVIAINKLFCIKQIYHNILRIFLTLLTIKYISSCGNIVYIGWHTTQMNSTWLPLIYIFVYRTTLDKYLNSHTNNIA